MNCCSKVNKSVIFYVTIYLLDIWCYFQLKPREGISFWDARIRRRQLHKKKKKKQHTFKRTIYLFLILYTVCHVFPKLFETFIPTQRTCLFKTSNYILELGLKLYVFTGLSWILNSDRLMLMVNSLTRIIIGSDRWIESLKKSRSRANGHCLRTSFPFHLYWSQRSRRYHTRLCKQFSFIISLAASCKRHSVQTKHVFGKTFFWCNNNHYNTAVVIQLSYRNALTIVGISACSTHHTAHRPLYRVYWSL